MTGIYIIKAGYLMILTFMSDKTLGGAWRPERESRMAYFENGGLLCEMEKEKLKVNRP